MKEQLETYIGLAAFMSLGLLITWLCLRWLYKFFKAGYKPETHTQDLVCTQCGTRGQSRIVIKGSTAVEVVLWLFVVSWPFALVYTVWRRSGAANVCAVCGGNLIPATTPQGKVLSKILPAQKSN